MKIFDLEKYGNTYKIQLNVTSYTEGNLAVTMTSWEDGEAEPWNVLTVNLNSIRPQNCAFIDTNNNGEDILAWIIRPGSPYRHLWPQRFLQLSGIPVPSGDPSGD